MKAVIKTKILKKETGARTKVLRTLHWTPALYNKNSKGNYKNHNRNKY